MKMIMMMIILIITFTINLFHFLITGKTLVILRKNITNSYDLHIRRDLEENGTQIRLISTQTNLNTGEDSETMSIFKLNQKLCRI